MKKLSYLQERVLREAQDRKLRFSYGRWRSSRFQTVTKTVDSLVSRGLVRVSVGAGDIPQIALTSDGVSALEVLDSLAGAERTPDAAADAADSARDMDHADDLLRGTR